MADANEDACAVLTFSVLCDDGAYLDQAIFKCFNFSSKFQK